MLRTGLYCCREEEEEEEEERGKPHAVKAFCLSN